jgi:hypothetical protein
MMEQLAGLDPSALAGGFVALLLLLCVVALFLMRDPDSEPPHVVSRSIWCAARRRQTTVEFVERVETGLPIRTVQRCALRDAGGPCNQECCDLSAVEAEPRRGDMTADRSPVSG